MPGVSDVTAESMLDSLTTFFLALFTVNPNFQTGAGGTEATGGGYARIAVTMAAAAGRARTNTSGPHEFILGTNIAAGTYTGFALYSASTGGVFQGGAALAASRVLAVTGDKISYGVGDIDLTLPNS